MGPKRKQVTGDIGLWKPVVVPYYNSCDQEANECPSPNTLTPVKFFPRPNNHGLYLDIMILNQSVLLYIGLSEAFW